MVQFVAMKILSKLIGLKSLKALKALKVHFNDLLIYIFSYNYKDIMHSH